jgi:sarcosine oxidase/L-pipecolate oxidase
MLGSSNHILGYSYIPNVVFVYLLDCLFSSYISNISLPLISLPPSPSPSPSPFSYPPLFLSNLTPQIDTSRIIRPDYASPPYTRLATLAQQKWRTTFAPAHYHETGLCVTASGPEQQYVSSSYHNVQALGADTLEKLNFPDEIKSAAGLETNVSTGDGDKRPGGGSMGYVNWNSGWADAEGAMIWLRNQVEATNRVHFLTGTVRKLLFDHDASTVRGALLTSGETLTADLTLLAAGAWSPSLIDLRGIVKPTGQTLVYMPISHTAQSALSTHPTILNLSTGLFMIPPSRNLLKIARHGHGYTNPTTIPHPESRDGEERETITISLPYTHVDDTTQIVPLEAQNSCLDFLRAIHPSLIPSTNSSTTTTSLPWTKSRICWYADTRSGDFLISHHPKWRGMFVATGGSGHAFKFLPVIGDSIVECILRRTPEDFIGKWEWPARKVPEEEWEGDGSRGGPVGMVLSEEMAKTKRVLEGSRL